MKRDKDHRCLETDPRGVRYFREQEEKLFIASLQLRTLDKDQVAEYATKIIDREYQAQLEKKRQQEDQDEEDELRMAQEAANEPEPTDSKPIDPDEPMGGPVSQEEIETNQTGKRYEYVDIPTTDAETKVAWNKRVEAAQATIRQVEERRRRRTQSRPSQAANNPLPPITYEDATFTDVERQALKDSINGINPTVLTPRSIRSFVLRYQLIRLILCELGHSFRASDVLRELAAQLRLAPKTDGTALSAVEQMAVEMVAGIEEEHTEPPSEIPPKSK